MKTRPEMDAVRAEAVLRLPRQSNYDEVGGVQCVANDGVEDWYLNLIGADDNRFPRRIHNRDELDQYMPA